MIFGQKIYNLMSKKLLKNSINSSAKIYRYVLTNFVSPAISGISGFPSAPSTDSEQPAPIKKPTRILFGARHCKRSVARRYGQCARAVSVGGLGVEVAAPVVG